MCVCCFGPSSLFSKPPPTQPWAALTYKEPRCPPFWMTTCQGCSCAIRLEKLDISPRQFRPVLSNCPIVPLFSRHAKSRSGSRPSSKLQFLDRTAVSTTPTGPALGVWIPVPRPRRRDGSHIRRGASVDAMKHAGNINRSRTGRYYSIDCIPSVDCWMHQFHRLNLDLATAPTRRHRRGYWDRLFHLTVVDIAKMKEPGVCLVDYDLIQTWGICT